jgi:hypothetical protein
VARVEQVEPAQAAREQAALAAQVRARAEPAVRTVVLAFPEPAQVYLAPQQAASAPAVLAARALELVFRVVPLAALNLVWAQMLALPLHSRASELLAGPALASVLTAELVLARLSAVLTAPPALV